MPSTTTTLMPPPRVSVLLPSYDHAPFVLGAVQSALDQTETALEVIVVDDGSTDDSLARLATIDDPRVVVIAQENRGLSRTLNRAGGLARGRWVKFLPSDDMLVPRCLEVQLHAAEAQGGGVVFCLPEVVDAAGRPLADPAPQAWFDTAAREGPDLLVGLVERNFLSAPGALFERELALAVGGFDAEMRVAQDYDLWLKLLARGPARLVPERLVRVRWHGANQSAIATPATEAERERALTRAIGALGIDGWAARFARGATGRRAAVQGRLALAGALERSGLPGARAIAAQVAREASRMPAGSGARAGRSLVRGLGRVLRGIRRGIRPRWRAALDAGAGSGAAPGARVAAARIEPGACGEHWIVLDRVPASVAAGAGSRGAAQAAALARRGLRVTHAAPPGASGAPGEAPGVTSLAFDLAALRARLVDPSEALVRLVVGAPHPEAIALAREGAAAGARVVFDRVVAWESRADAAWYDPESERKLVEAAHDLVAGGAAAGARLMAARRLVHLLPSPEDGARVAVAWDAHAASLVQIVARPVVTALLVGRGDEAGLAAALAALLAARRTHSHPIVVVLTEPVDGAAAEAAEAALAAGEIALLRSAAAIPAAARELGLRATSGEIVAWLSAASTPRIAAGWMDDPLRLLLAHREIGAVAVGHPCAAGDARAGAGGGAVAGAWREAPDLAAPIVVARRGVVARLPAEPAAGAPGEGDLERRLRAAGYRLAALG